MKKILKVMTSLALVAMVLVGCAQPEQSSEPAAAVDVRVAGLKGPTTMGMVQMMNKVDNGEITSNNYNFEMITAIDEVNTKIAKGEVDIAAVPANVASVLYNNLDGGVQVLSTNTLGVLYMVDNGSTITDIASLKGKTIYASGKGATPEYALRYVLSGNGIDPDSDVTIEWKSEQAEVVSAMAANPSGIAMLPEPFVTTAMTSTPTLRAAIDLTAEWDKLEADKTPKSTLITGVTIVRKEFAEQNPEAVADFMKLYEESMNYTSTNVDEAAALVGKYDIVPEAVAKVAIPKCNIKYIAGEEMKEKLSGYLTVLHTANPQSVGGQLPGDDFYYMNS